MWKLCRMIPFKGGAMIAGLMLSSMLLCAAPASAQECLGGGDDTNASTVTGGQGTWRIHIATTKESCTGTESESWLDVASNCYNGTVQNGRCNKRNIIGNSFVESYVGGCGDVYGHGYHYWLIPGYEDIWTPYGPTSVNLHTGCYEPEPGCDIPPYPEECIDPIILATTPRGRNYRLTSIERGVVFDIDGDGVGEQVAWTESGDDTAFLVYDANGDGAITSGKELVGNLTVPGATNGFQALQELNLKLNGRVRVGSIDADQPLFAKLLLWNDRNHNGVSEPSELRPFGDLFASILPAWWGSPRRDGNGNTYRYEGQVFVRTGGGRNYPQTPDEVQLRAMKVYDVFLGASKQ